LQITLEQYEIEAAIKKYMQSQFGIKAVGVEIGGTKTKFTAAITMDVSTKVTLGSAEIEILPGKDVKTESPFVSDQAEAITETVEEKTEPLPNSGLKPAETVVDTPVEKTVVAVKANPLFAAQPAAEEKAVVTETDELVEDEALPAAKTPVSADTLFAPQK